MGKIYIIKDNDNQVKYPVTVSDAVVVDKTTLTKKLEDKADITYVDNKIGDINTILESL